MQLFTIGIPKIDKRGLPIAVPPGVSPTAYTEQDVKELARIFTGWTFGDGNPATIPTRAGSENYKVPMEAVANYHDKGEKVFLGQTFPAGQTARQDLDQALDLLFNNSNLGPFVSRQLIQQLVTSNPSPAYVADVAAVFSNDDGDGVRGDLAAVVRAILTHPGAGQSTATSGKLSEPALFVASVLRGLNAAVTDHPFASDKAESMGQRVLYPGSVFSYFSPGYRCAAPRVLEERRLADRSSRSRRRSRRSSARISSRRSSAGSSARTSRSTTQGLRTAPPTPCGWWTTAACSSWAAGCRKRRVSKSSTRSGHRRPPT